MAHQECRRDESSLHIFESLEELWIVTTLMLSSLEWGPAAKT